MRAPVVVVTAALTFAILLAASFLIANGTHGKETLAPLASDPAWAGPMTDTDIHSKKSQRQHTIAEPGSGGNRHHLIQ
jgi:hypothetical protein